MVLLILTVCVWIKVGVDIDIIYCSEAFYFNIR